ncbi:hypothetical protein BGX28_004922 [Mortierella sp. GBA30]|nr:hypothetical protein BGX28_004922 [Mortierella sp. GBA30]
MRLNVIATVDETSRQCGSSMLASGERDSTPSARAIVYVSREQCILHKLRNSVIALALPTTGQETSTPFYALVKVYSKESMLFRKDTRYPERLGVRESEVGSTKAWDVVVSKFLWWEIAQQHENATPFQACQIMGDFHEDIDMPAGHSPLEMDAKVVRRDRSIHESSLQITNLGNATHVTLDTYTHTDDKKPLPNGAAIAQSLSGSIVSLHGWISFKSPYGSQTFKVSQITSSNSDHPDVALMSESTVIRYALLSSDASSIPSIRTTDALTPNLNKSLITKAGWIEAVKCVIGGYDDVLEQIIDHLYGYIECAIHGSGGMTATVVGERTSQTASYAGASENYLRDAFATLLSRGKASLLVLDEVDMIASSRASRKGVEAKLFATLLHLVDSINMGPTGSKIFIIALTNRIHAVDNSLLRSGRLDKVFDLHLKGVEQRLRVLEILSKDLPMYPEQRLGILRKVAKATHGYVPTDLQALCTESAVAMISRNAAGETLHSVIDFAYFEHAMKTIRPSGMGEFQSKIPTVKFNNLYGIDDAIADLKVSIIEPFQHPKKYLDLGIAPPRGVIVHGPPGVGKTMLCCALAEELGINFMLVESSQIRSKVVGESEQNIARMFAQAKANAPCILFIDQIDVLAPSRGSTHTSENSGDRIVTGLLTATNRPEVIDAAILRPGRLDQIVHIPVPDEKTRRAILKGYMGKMPMNIGTDEIQDLVRTTEGYSGADLENLCREAALICLRQDIRNTEITVSHLEAAKSVSKPSLLGYQDSHLFSR